MSDAKTIMRDGSRCMNKQCLPYHTVIWKQLGTEAARYKDSKVSGQQGIEVPRQQDIEVSRQRGIGVVKDSEVLGQQGMVAARSRGSDVVC